VNPPYRYGSRAQFGDARLIHAKPVCKRSLCVIQLFQQRPKPFCIHMNYSYATTQQNADSTTNCPLLSGRMNTTAQRLFDIPGAVEYLRSIGAGAASPWFVRSLISRGELPHLRIGKKFYVSREALDTWISKHERRAR
jgi:excisionase family DNA binding protein